MFEDLNDILRVNDLPDYNGLSMNAYRFFAVTPNGEDKMLSYGNVKFGKYNTISFLQYICKSLRIANNLAEIDWIDNINTDRTKKSIIATILYINDSLMKKILDYVNLNERQNAKLLEEINKVVIKHNDVMTNYNVLLQNVADLLKKISELELLNIPSDEQKTLVGESVNKFLQNKINEISGKIEAKYLDSLKYYDKVVDKLKVEINSYGKNKLLELSGVYNDKRISTKDDVEYVNQILVKLDERLKAGLDESKKLISGIILNYMNISNGINKVKNLDTIKLNTIKLKILQCKAKIEELKK